MLKTQFQQASLNQMSQEIRLLREENKLLQKDLQEAKYLSQLIGRLKTHSPSPPTWITRKSPKHDRAIPLAFLSDLHADEVIEPAQVGFKNSYGRRIATRRVENFFRNAIKISKQYLKGLDYEGICLPLGGDLFSGNIHEELRETNASSLYESITYWIDPLLAGILLLEREFGSVFIPAVVGNHGRNSQRPRYKGRAENNVDWLLYKLLERETSGRKRISWKISDGVDAGFTLFSTRFLLTHGDEFPGGSGIASLLSPLMIGDYRRRKRQQAMGTPYDYLLMGHWHQREFFKGVIVNGSIKGYDELAMAKSWDFQEPQQSFLIVDPIHRVTITAPIFVKDKGEKY